MVPSSCRHFLTEIIFVDPGEVASFTGVFKAVLGALFSINVEEILILYLAQVSVNHMIVPASSSIQPT